jgi:ABC-type multidrug transport system ATPase subunit/pSer/pThr/pTyr-binding forkhead associated (FHA) protein/ABC-type multidrug transport system permease subunit
MNILLSLNNKTQEITLAPNKKYIIGRSSSADIIANFDAISGNHLKIWLEGGDLFIEDLDSTNGTYIDLHKILAGQPIKVGSNKVVYLSNKKVFIKIQEKRGMSSSQINSPPTKSISELLKNKSELFIGRSADCDIVINDVAVSRKHARVYKEKGKVFVKDYGSTNGIYLNGKKITKAELRNEDTFFIMLHAFSLKKAPTNYSNEVAISAIAVTKVFSNGFQGLQKTTLQVPYKKMVALMGPSGCGKSTLMKALNGDSPPTEGSVKIFGLDMAEHFEMLKHIIGYVPQENIVHEDLTVEQSLYYAAKLRLPEDTSNEYILKRITEVLEALKINNSDIRKNKVAKLSGGQKKRISIAVEILSKPKILFLDEPTSPLDPETIEEFLNCVKGLCENGTTVVMVTHKPDDLNYVDKVIFMGVEGHLVFDGVKEDLLPHFKMDNLIALYAMLSHIKKTKYWYQDWVERNKLNEKSSPKKIKVSQLQVNRGLQIFWLSRRYLSVKVGNLKNLSIMLLQPVLIAILVILAFDYLIIEQVISIPMPDGTESEESKTIPNTGLLFLMAIAAIWFGVSNSAKEIVGEKDILKREYMINMRLSSYLISKLLILTLISSIQVSILLGLLFFSYQNLTSFVFTFEFLMVVSLCSITFGLLLSSVTSTTEEVMSILPIALMPQIILAGVIQPIENEITMYLSYFTLGRWGTEGLARIQDLEQEEQPFMGQLSERLYNQDLYEGELKDIAINSLTSNIYFLLLLFLLMILIVYFLNKNKLKSSK